MKEYHPSIIEPKWQAYWDEHQTYRTERLPKEKKLYCLDMFPYPSGKGLHVGHPLGYTGSDIFSRYKRMQGYSVLHPMGFDAFGLPAEQHAVRTGEHPSIITEQNCATFVKQLKQLGFSYDWSREIATCRPEYYRWTQWIFLKLYNSWFDEEQQRARPIEELPIPEEVRSQGERAVFEYQAERRLAYYADAMVNWCPALGTVLANEEVIDGKSERGGHDVIRKPMKQWMLRITKYAERLLSELDEIAWPEAIKEQQRNWIGKKRGAEISFKLQGRDESIVAFTTRPDTLFGVTFFVIAPEHPLVATVTTDAMREKVEAYREEARKLSDLQRTIENRKKTGVFTGSHVVNPITGDAIPLFVGDYVLTSVGTGAVMGVPAHDERDFEFARTFRLPIVPVIVPQDESQELRDAVVQGEVAWTEPGMMLPCDQPVARELGLVGMPSEEASRKIVGWLEKHGHGRAVVTYKLRDWLFSRQRYWGEPIPIVHWEDGTSSALREEELPLLLPQVEDYKPSEGGESPLAKAGDWLEVVDPATGKRGRRETNTMPQWAGSCWYYLRFIDPHNSERAWDPELEKAWMPVDLYVGGAEHAVLHLLYARFWHKVLFDLGYVSTREPFQQLFNQGMIQSHAFKDQRGALVPIDEVEEKDGAFLRTGTGEQLERVIAKMSKSLKNVINPDDVIEEYGADTLRVYLMFMGPLDAARVWDSNAINGSHRFLKRAYGLVAGRDGFIAEDQESDAVRRAVHRLVKKVTEDMEALSYNTSIAAMMEFLNEVGSSPISRETAERFVKVLAPFAPHLGEELWSLLGHSSSVAHAEWPTYEERFLQAASVTVVVQVRGKKRALIEVAPDIGASALQDEVIRALAGSEFAVSDADRFITVTQPGTSIPRLVNVIPKG